MQNGASRATTSTDAAEDLIGGPWAIIESDPGVFTMVMQKLGVGRCEAAEVYSVDADGLSHLDKIHGFVFCSQVQAESSLTMHDVVQPDDGSEPDKPWFSSQLIHNACATQAIINVLLNCSDVNLGETLGRFKEFTQNMSPVMRGLSLCNDHHIRDTHNSMARPADLRDALHAAARDGILDEKDKKLAKKSRRGTTESKEDIYHYVGYVPLGGKVWELDGLRSGPLEVGDIEESMPTNAWLDVVRPAIRLKMEDLQEHEGNDIRFNLLAIVESGFEKHSDHLELLRREKVGLERRLASVDPEWQTHVEDKALPERAAAAFGGRQYKPFDPAFGLAATQRAKSYLELPENRLQSEWARCIAEAESLNPLIDDELQKASRWKAENIKRSHDYEPFFREYLTALHENGLLEAILDTQTPSNGTNADVGEKRRPGRPKKSSKD